MMKMIIKMSEMVLYVVDSIDVGGAELLEL